MRELRELGERGDHRDNACNRITVRGTVPPACSATFILQMAFLDVNKIDPCFWLPRFACSACYVATLDANGILQSPLGNIPYQNSTLSYFLFRVYVVAVNWFAGSLIRHGAG